MKNNIAFMGILLALNAIFMFLSNIIITNKIFFMALASLPVSIIIIEIGLKESVLFYIASVILGFIIMPNKLYIVPYALFFGIYGIIKYLIEKDRNIFLDIIMKIVSFNVLFFIAYYIGKSFAVINLNLLLIMIANVVFIIYDYAYGMFIHYYYESFRKKIKRN